MSDLTVVTVPDAQDDGEFEMQIRYAVEDLKALGGREIRLRRREAFEPGVDWSVRDKVWVEVDD